MRRLAALLLAVAAAAVAGTARADTFEVVPVAPAATATSTDQLLPIWQQAGAAYGIPWQVLAAINKVETNFGRNMGPSSAGAIGWMQFMPQTWFEWGVDANGDGIADPWNSTDAIWSAARYLAAAGGAADLPRAIYAYNHADWYVREVLQLADLYRNGFSETLSLDTLQTQLDTARSDAVAAAERVTAAGVQVRALQARVRNATLLSDRLALQPALARAMLALQRERAALADARAALARAQQAAAAAEFAPAASTMLAGPSYAGSYVFPVGGGAGTVSASHTHHDYPAVDIAAPLGAPVYALADGVVVRAWNDPDPRCGIGFTFQTDDGQTWTYCHMALLEPGVAAGERLAAGEGVGLVGATGDATGPHLHLQLQPATGWPQDESWFTSFAGSAFTWADDPGQSDVRVLASVHVGAPGPVFTVISASPEPSSGGVVLFSRR